MAALQTPLPPDENRGPQLNIISWTLTGLAAAFVVARVFTRSRITHSVGSDDYIIVFSIVMQVIAVALCSVSVSYGLGRHIQYIPDNQLSPLLYYAGLCQPFGIAAFCFPKLAVALLLIRLMGPKQSGQIFLYTILTIQFISGALCGIFLYAQCDPPSHFWKPMEPAECMNPHVLTNIMIFAGAWSAFADLSLALFPITILWSLQIERSRKISIAALMGLGIFAMVCTIIKSTHLPKEQDPDFSWAFYELIVWTFIEADVIIICACIPILPPFVEFVRGRIVLLSSLGSSKTGSTPQSSYDRDGYQTFDLSPHHSREGSHSRPSKPSATADEASDVSSK